jgi:hypothetical protein
MPPKRARKPKKKSTNKLSQSQTVIINRGGGGKKKGGITTVASKPQQPINISHVTHVYNDRKTETKTTEPTPTPSPTPASSPFSGMSYTSSPFSYTSTLPSDFSIRQESQPFASYGFGGMRRRQFPTGGGGEGATEPIIEEPMDQPTESSPTSRITRIEDITQPRIIIPQQLPPFSNLPQFPSIPRDIFQSMQQANDSQSVMQPLILPDEPMQQIEDAPMLQIEDAPRKDIRDDAERVQQALLNEYSSPMKPSPPPPPPPPRGRGRPVEPITEEEINILDRYVRGLSIPSRNRTDQQRDDVLRGARLRHNKRQHPDLNEILLGLRQIYFP